MTVRSVVAVSASLLDKGMERDETHHHMFRRSIEGVTTLVTRISHNAKEIDDGLGRLMANQLCLQLREFWEFVDCPLDEPGWTALVRQRCMGGSNPFLRR